MCCCLRAFQGSLEPSLCHHRNINWTTIETLTSWISRVSDISMYLGAISPVLAEHFLLFRFSVLGLIGIGGHWILVLSNAVNREAQFGRSPWLVWIVDNVMITWQRWETALRQLVLFCQPVLTGNVRQIWKKNMAWLEKMSNGKTTRGKGGWVGIDKMHEEERWVRMYEPLNWWKCGRKDEQGTCHKETWAWTCEGKVSKDQPLRAYPALAKKLPARKPASSCNPPEHYFLGLLRPSSYVRAFLWTTLSFIVFHDKRLEACPSI